MLGNSTDALSVLAADHKAVQLLLAEYDELASDHADVEERQSLATQICWALTAHAAAAEEVFYPALAEALGDDGLVDDALAGHDGLRAVVEQIEALDASDERFDALMLVLASAVARHVREEERELFPRVRTAGLDLDRIGARITRRRDEWLRQLLEASA
ncbi:MAG: hemerythrin domain-containing protein [Rubrivivax sp.]|nr:MAG: hemerythrin domain-containing protein [Rubrivivax sp.]